ncbi:chemotaxis protein CheW [Ruminococcus albus]|uniref:Purine-binding chemotaxis protein CheW n=1 Tax=Ruminococcus albus TaxID=1264 RepID=A0A1H7GZZ8_RUMAL|nr:chemotaxis protein CheW [Ruminococcus albus]SEK43057.1 purine-binding chemotaxis protein CheW [Ruminococcus albus]
MADIYELLDNGGQLLTFTVGGEHYGFYILSVADIIEMPEFTLIPTAPPYVLGLMNHRGKAVPVMDLRLRMGLPQGEYDDRSCVIVIEVNTMQCGLVVDRVSDVENVTSDMIARSPVDNGLVKGFVIREDKPKISILDPEAVART